LISESESSSKNFHRSVMSFMTRLQNLRSVRPDLIGFRVVLCDLTFQISLYDVLGLVGIFS